MQPQNLQFVSNLVLFWQERQAMRVFLGMIFGAIFTVVGTYSYDVATGKAPTTDAPASVPVDERPMVNWDVVGRNWQSLESNLREMATRVHEHACTNNGQNARAEPDGLLRRSAAHI